MHVAFMDFVNHPAECMALALAVLLLLLKSNGTIDFEIHDEDEEDDALVLDNIRNMDVALAFDCNIVT